MDEHGHSELVARLQAANDVNEKIKELRRIEHLLSSYRGDGFVMLGVGGFSVKLTGDSIKSFLDFIQYEIRVQIKLYKSI